MFKCCRFEARRVAEISDWSTIFGLWRQKMLFGKRIMTKPFFHDFLYPNIASYQILIYHFGHILAPKIVFLAYFLCFWSYFRIWMLYMHIIAYEHAYDIIGQKSSIGQKFRSLRAPQNDNIWWCLENKQKSSQIFTVAIIFLIF